MRAGHGVWGKSTRSSPHPALPEGAEPRWALRGDGAAGTGTRQPPGSSAGSAIAQQPPGAVSPQKNLGRNHPTRVSARGGRGGWPRLIFLKNTWVINRHTNNSGRAERGGRVAPAPHRCWARPRCPRRSQPQPSALPRQSPAAGAGEGPRVRGLQGRERLQQTQEGQGSY